MSQRWSPRRDGEDTGCCGSLGLAPCQCASPRQCAMPCCETWQTAETRCCLAAQTGNGVSISEAPRATTSAEEKCSPSPGTQARCEPPACPSLLPVLATWWLTGHYAITKWPHCKPCSRSQLEITISPRQGSCPRTPYPPHPPQCAAVCL